MHPILRNILKILEVTPAYSNGGLPHDYTQRLALRDTEFSLGIQSHCGTKVKYKFLRKLIFEIE